MDSCASKIDSTGCPEERAVEEGLSDVARASSHNHPPAEDSTPSAGACETKMAGDNTESVVEVEDGNDRPMSQQNHQDQNNESSVFPTAFTISFDDDSNASKKFGIRDSIRKFAPPKPHTIEKPRQAKNECQDNSLVSIESAPAGLYTKHSRSKGNCSNSSRSSGRRSTSSRHSNISESAAFLIDRMLSFKQSDINNSAEDKNSSTKSPSSIKSRKTTPHTNQKAGKRMAHSSDDILVDSEIDFSEDKSDNGTYIVGADPESDAARKKIDELFGVVKAAEASVIADSKKQRHLEASKATGRQSRSSDKKSTSVQRGSSVSRSSSSSRHENLSASERQHNHNHQRSTTRHLRNSSSERVSRGFSHTSHRQPRRSISQSSRQSSNKELSDGDSRSSRSSLHTNDIEIIANASGQDASLPSMKFNRAFALRRARLGLGEPVRVSSSTSNQLEAQSESTATINNNNLSTSHKRHQINTNTYKAANHSSSSTGSANFCREDGGRFSLRMKNNVMPGTRLASQHPHHHQATTSLASPTSNQRLPQHNALLDSYMCKISAGKSAGNVDSQYISRNLSKSKYQHQLPNTNAATNYSQSGDELEPITSPSRYKLFLKSTNRLHSAGPRASNSTADVDISDSESYANMVSSSRYNYPQLGADYDPANNYSSLISTDSRAGSSIGGGGKLLQLGALDSLVISAISSLSMKIRASVCDVLVEQAKKLPVENETRLIVEEILPQLNAPSVKSPTSIEEIDQALSFDLTKTLKNLKKVEQMVDVISLISNQLPNSSTTPSLSSSAQNTKATASSSTASTANSG